MSGMRGRCPELVPDGPDPDDTDVCSAKLREDGTCPNYKRHVWQCPGCDGSCHMGAGAP